MNTQLMTLRVFVRWLATIDGVDPDLHRKIRTPDIRPGDDARDVMLEPEYATEMLGYLARYEYASLAHVTLAILCMTLDDWLRDRRPAVTDEYGRAPLLATVQGRASGSNIRWNSYRYSRPCAVAQECPEGRDPETCEATAHDDFSKCPVGVSPHAIRRGSITHHLHSDIPETAVGDRANVSQRVIERQYDQRTEKEKMEQRRAYLDNL